MATANAKFKSSSADKPALIARLAILAFTERRGSACKQTAGNLEGDRICRNLSRDTALWTVREIIGFQGKGCF
jgi:hypothetical protein